jgi:hypothetical protein
MKTIIKSIFSKLLFSSSILLSITSCDDFLEPKVYDRISGSSFYQTDEDAKAAIIGLYSFFGSDVTQTNASRLLMGEYGTDGYVEKNPLFNNLDWESDRGYPFHEAYNRSIPFVTKAGTVLANLEDMTFKNESLKALYMGEARLARSIVMFDLLNWFGPSAIVVEKEKLLFPDNSYMPVRMTNEEYVTLLKNELTKAIDELPEQNEVGRFNKNIAKMVLLKFYMHQKNWDGAQQISAELIGKYELADDYKNIWSIDNENSKEVIWSISRISNNADFRNVSRMRSNFPLISKITKETTWGGSGMDKYSFNFRATFDGADTRKTNLIDTMEYLDKRGKTQYIILSQEADAWGASPLKYGFDPIGIDDNGVDVIVFRYADVLLCRAEALNNLNGPNQESIDLINQVRSRAKISAVNLADFPSKDALNDHILSERGWEFWYEGLRREDLIRHGKYISEALKRDSKFAKDFMVLYSIPKGAYNENPNIKQNEGYKF